MNRRSFLKGIGVGLLALNSVSGLKSVVETLAFERETYGYGRMELIVEQFMSMKNKLVADVLTNDPRIEVTTGGKLLWSGPSPYPDGLSPSVEMKSKSS